MILTILTHPNPELRKKSKSVRTLTPELRQLIADMAETMYKANGVGLAAPQVGQRLRIVILDITETRDQLLVLVNPKITRKSKEKDVLEEGCLSVPGVVGDVERSTGISVEAQNVKGKQVEFEVCGFLARAIQHEMDHLNGVLYIDHLYGDAGLRPAKPGTRSE